MTSPDTTKLNETTKATLRKAYTPVPDIARHAQDIKEAYKEATDRYGPDHPITQTLGGLHGRTQQDLLSATE